MIDSSAANLRLLPEYLHQYIVDQHYEQYTEEDHAVWRYMMKLSFSFLSKHAHPSYIQGLQQTGIGMDRIPDLVEMNRILDKIGWAAVCVDGFIPPNAFMEFQAYRVLVIAANIRTLEHIQYTPAPDIFHEAAGHAPIIANAEYSAYLQLFGQIGSKALCSKQDVEIYEAVRTLSILKENSLVNKEEVMKAEMVVLDLQNQQHELSEMAQIRNLHWWTVEYGLIGELENPKIYGAGLLSSIGESKECLHAHVKKIPYNLEAYSQSFDITQPQPQLYVARDFTHLNEVLLQFSESMAYRTGGDGALKKALNCGHEVTIELSSGAQICGKVDRLHNDEFGHPAYLNTIGPTCLSNLSQPILNQDFEHHAQGFGMPLGKWKSVVKNPELLSDYELRQIGIEYHKKITLEYESGVKVEGEVFQIVRNEWGKLLIITFKDCTVHFQNQILFNPDWGIYDLVLGADVVSVFAGLPKGYQSKGNTAVSATKTTIAHSENTPLMGIYQQIRSLRESGCNTDDLTRVMNQIDFNIPNLWLLMLECFELAHKNQFISLKQELEENLIAISQNHLHLSSNILDGLNVYSQ